ncbi:50S ribosomal protein L6 [Geobacter benzoatilyticus]|jgi:large subunit ribosomal protein L6|uniref:Large ribosomal subunit protein uL6 n=1 Tax=Geobacter benzoatilyticus TaxID=2815309 RepID=A0ABX7PZN7_9BACT|nr:50S ribosomal protein L6 [Geobacter benzoatilyticus]MDA8226112.1 50S ribosomal protein L6 [Desulfitobacterium hafniense]QSV44288.1 50S ribosomal protein L6 [Geobacter benzoatilyticus]
MSRIGKRPIEIPSGVKILFNNPMLKVEGPKGSLSREIMSEITLEIDEKNINVVRADDGIKSRSAHGLTRTLINNMVVGVTKGFEKILEINGVGYRAEAKGDVLNLSLGYSHPINYQLPQGITVEVDKMTKVFVRGIDKELVGQTAAKIRSFRGPEPYKGKGVKYADERILRKAGKTGKK